MVDTYFSINHRIASAAFILLMPLFVASYPPLAAPTALAASMNEAVTIIEQQETDSAINIDPSSITRDEINVVAREIWCPLCSGVRLDVCELQACNQMREEIAIQLAQGADTEEIKSYFLAQYGPQILGEPPRSGFNWLAWVVPFASLLGIGVYLFMTRRPQKQKDDLVYAFNGNPDEAHVDIESNGEGAGSLPDAHSHSAKAPADDMTDYEQLLDEELKTYE